MNFSNLQKFQKNFTFEILVVFIYFFHYQQPDKIFNFRFYRRSKFAKSLALVKSNWITDKSGLLTKFFQSKERYKSAFFKAAPT